jgi:hypothetical protein
VRNSRDAWVDAVRPERKDFVSLLLRSDFFPRPCLAIAAWERTTVFRLLVKESGTFPRGTTEVGALRTAIQKSRAIAKRLVSDWQWPLTVRIFLGLFDAMEEIHLVGPFRLVCVTNC